MQEVINRSKLLILCDVILTTNTYAAEYTARPTQWNLQRQRLWNAKLLELTNRYLQEAMQEISSELDEEAKGRKQEGKEPKRYKNEETDN